ncbi:gag-polypeptide of LTR copia-type [Ceratobasidium sp. AG-Ba]|nr:gag-polypeptide of LTR copia-type [Ceratobasidium sp. AG-Ba]
MSNMNTSSSTSVYRITPLHGTENFNTWRIQMEDILINLGLFEYVNGASRFPTYDTIKVPDPTAVGSNGKPDPNTTKDVLSTTMNKEQEKWIKDNCLIDLRRRKFFSHRMTDREDVKEHMHKMRNWSQQINIILPHAISEVDWITTLVASLPNSWDSFTQSVDFNFDFKNMNVLKHTKEAPEEITFQSNKDSLTHSQQITVKVQQLQKNGTLGKGMLNGGKSSFNQFMGPNNKRVSNNAQAHAAIDTNEAPMDPIDSFAFSACDDKMGFLSQSSNQWIADSGMTTHIACDQTSFDDYHQQKPPGIPTL